jgi:hypothetical protein
MPSAPNSFATGGLTPRRTCQSCYCRPKILDFVPKLPDRIQGGCHGFCSPLGTDSKQLLQSGFARQRKSLHARCRIISGAWSHETASPQVSSSPRCWRVGCYGGATLGLVATARFGSCSLSDMDRARRHHPGVARKSCELPMSCTALGLALPLIQINVLGDSGQQRLKMTVTHLSLSDHRKCDVLTGDDSATPETC